MKSDGSTLCAPSVVILNFDHTSTGVPYSEKDTETPGLPSGEWRAVVADQQITWTLEGPSTFLFRQAIETDTLPDVVGQLLGEDDITVSVPMRDDESGTLSLRIAYDKPIQMQILQAWLGRAAGLVDPQSPWLGPIGLQIPATACPVEPHTGAGWLFRPSADKHTWAVTSPLSNESLTALRQHLHATVTPTEGCE